MPHFGSFDLISHFSFSSLTSEKFFGATHALSGFGFSASVFFALEANVFFFFFFSFSSSFL